MPGDRDRPTLTIESLAAEASPAPEIETVETLAAALSGEAAPADVLATAFEGTGGEILHASSRAALMASVGNVGRGGRGGGWAARGGRREATGTLDMMAE